MLDRVERNKECTIAKQECGSRITFESRRASAKLATPESKQHACIIYSPINNGWGKASDQKLTPSATSQDRIFEGFERVRREEAGIVRSTGVAGHDIETDECQTRRKRRRR